MSLPDLPEPSDMLVAEEAESSHLSLHAPAPSARGSLRKASDLWKPPSRWKVFAYGGILLVLIVGGLLSQKVYAFANAISLYSPLSSQLDFSGSSRLNLLVLVYEGGNGPGAYITDSMLLISVQPRTGQTTLISIPRDLGVHLPADATQYFKIDTAYEYGLVFGNGAEGIGKVAGGDLATHKIAEVTGLNVTYWMTLDFQGFRHLIDALGGVDITVKDSFTALYPKNDDPAIDASYITVHFSAGLQHMNSQRAIEYARTRQVLDNAAENSDFARSARQQQLVKAVVTKMVQVPSWPHLFTALDALQSSIYTNLSARDLYTFVHKMDSMHAKDIVLSTQNILHTAIENDGLPLLLPANGNYDLIKQYIQQQLAHS